MLMVARAAVASAMFSRSLVDPAVPFVRVAAAKVLAVPVAGGGDAVAGKAAS